MKHPPDPLYKGETLQIIYSLNSSSTIPKSCTTFGRRNYLLRLSQIFKNQGYLTRRKHVLGSAIVRLTERFGEFLVGSDPGGQAVEGRSWTDIGSIGLCQFDFVIGSDSVFHLECQFWFMNYEFWCKDTQNQRHKQHKKSRSVIGFHAYCTNVIFPFSGCCIFVVSSGRPCI